MLPPKTITGQLISPRSTLNPAASLSLWWKFIPDVRSNMLYFEFRKPLGIVCTAFFFRAPVHSKKKRKNGIWEKKTRKNGKRGKRRESTMNWHMWLTTTCWYARRENKFVLNAELAHVTYSHVASLWPTNSASAKRRYVGNISGDGLLFLVGSKKGQATTTMSWDEWIILSHFDCCRRLITARRMGRRRTNRLFLAAPAMILADQ